MADHSFITTRVVGDMVCEDNTLAEWWMMHGYETPELRQLAIRVLSQVSSASTCKRSWSTHEFIHSKKRNKLSANKLADLANVHFNLNLWMRSLEGKTSSSRRVREVPPATSYDVGSSFRSVDGVSTFTHDIDDEDAEEMLRDEGIGSDEVEEFSDDSDEDGDAITFID